MSLVFRTAFRLIGFTLLALAVPQGAWAREGDLLENHVCTNILRELYSELKKTEPELLREFDFSAAILRGDPLDYKSQSGVYVLHNRADLMHYVVRLPGPTMSPWFERFNAEFFRRLPGLTSPQVRVLTEEETQLMIERLKAERPKEYLKILEWRAKVERLPSVVAVGKSATLTLYMPPVNGNLALANLGVVDLLRHDIATLPRRMDFLELMGRRHEMRRLWGNYSQAQKNFLTEDLRMLMQLDSTVPDERVFEKFLDDLSVYARRGTEDLTILGMKRVPAELRSQVADLWAGYTILGVSDPHPGNWLTDGEHMVGIDLAFPSQTFREGRVTLEIPNGMNPFGRGDLPEPVRSILMASISPKMKVYLRTLTADRLREIARMSGTTLSPKEIEGILGRARLILDDQTPALRSPAP